MTKYTTIEQQRKDKKKTVFKKILMTDFIVEKTSERPEEWENVLHIGKDVDYGDVFKVWNNSNPNDFIIFFGEKGDEF